MRLNSVPTSQPPPVMKNRISSQPKHSAVRPLYYHFRSIRPALPTKARSLQLVLVLGCVEKCYFGGQGAIICPGMSSSWSASWQMTMAVGVMEARGKLPLIKELQKQGGWCGGVDRLYSLPSAEPIHHAEPPLWASSWVNGWTSVG